MNILIPMAGAGSRFAEKGYVPHKPILPLTSRHSHETVPLVVEAVRDLPVDLERDDVTLLFIVRDFHIADNVDQVLLTYFPRAQFIVIDTLTGGQASTCLHARAQFDTDLPMMIAACDNGMNIPHETFGVFLANGNSGYVSAIVLYWSGYSLRYLGLANRRFTIWNRVFCGLSCREISFSR